MGHELILAHWQSHGLSRMKLEITDLCIHQETRTSQVTAPPWIIKQKRNLKSFVFTFIDGIFSQSLAFSSTATLVLPNQHTAQEEIELFIKWEETRAEYFRQQGAITKVNECTAKIKELRWKYALDEKATVWWGSMACFLKTGRSGPWIPLNIDRRWYDKNWSFQFDVFPQFQTCRTSWLVH